MKWGWIIGGAVGGFILSIPACAAISGVTPSATSVCGTVIPGLPNGAPAMGLGAAVGGVVGYLIGKHV